MINSHDITMISIILAIFLIITPYYCCSIPPEAKMTAVQIILYHGYPVQVFHAYTSDGYILDLHRIPFGKNGYSISRKYRPAIFLQHGLLGSSADWVENYPNESFGNYIKNDSFWKFSWDEMAKYDLDAMFDVVLKVTKQRSLYYVGFSQGTLIMFVKLSQDPNFASKIRKFFALAPVATVANVKGLFRLFATKIFPRAKLIQQFFGNRFFTLNSKLTKTISMLICEISFFNPFCNDIIFQIAGPDNGQFNKSRLSVYIGGEGGTSVMNMIHWVQMINSGKLQAYDYESVKENQRHYGNDSPPIYDISSVNVPIYLYWSLNDWLANTIDIRKSLLSVLPNKSIRGGKVFKNYNHLDFIWGLRAANEIYRSIISIIHKERTGIKSNRLMFIC
ncbi:alpha/beta-hydrolase lipase region family protein [Brugia pahangi]